MAYYKDSFTVYRGPVSIPGATIFSEKYWVWNGVYLAS
jgi:hypothetical protein